MPSTDNAFKSQPSRWTAERLAALSSDDLRQLRANAQSLGEAEVTKLCDQALGGRPPSVARRASAAVQRGRGRLISRARAFQARGVYLSEGAGSWSGVRQLDGMVVMSLWAGDVRSDAGGCAQLLWAPNTDGSRAWSDTAAGRARRAHCQLAVERGGAEGLLVHGERLEGYLAEDKARTVHGVDPELVVRLQVQRRGDEYWAVWGGRAEARPL